jgi:hypothetical protein
MEAQGRVLIFLHETDEFELHGDLDDCSLTAGIAGDRQ